MSDRIMGPEDTFLEIYLEHHYRKAKKMQTRARALGINPDELTAMARGGVATIEFELTIREEQNGTEIS